MWIWFLENRLQGQKAHLAQTELSAVTPVELSTASLLVQWILDWQTHVRGPERKS